MDKTIELAIEKAGGICKLATSLEIKHNSIYGWKRVPAERVRDVSRITGIKPHVLRPDIFEEPNNDANG